MWGWLAVGISGIVHLSAAERGQKTLAAIAKSVVLLLLLLMVLIQPGHWPYLSWLVAGLSLFLLVELLRLVPWFSRRLLFVGTVMAFSCYSISFWLQINGSLAWWLPALLFASGIIVFFLLLPRLDAQVLPVMVMGLVLLQLCWAATELCLRTPTLTYQLACAGSYLFALCGLLHTQQRFLRRSAVPSSLVSGGYILAQSLLVCSAVY